MAYMPQLDALRAIAVCMVLAEHLWHGRVDDAYKVFPWGTVGVTLFFVLSGFLISQILLGYKDKAAGNILALWGSLKTFYIRRAFRIFPLYYLLASSLLFLPFYSVTHYWPYFCFGNNFYFYFLNNWGQPFGHTWTLAVEEQFYLIWPFVLLFVPKPNLKTWIVAFIVSGLVFRLWAFGYLYPAHGLIGLLTPSSFDAFGLGALLAYIRRYENSTFTFLGGWKTILVLGVLAVCVSLNLYYEAFNYGILFFFSLAVLSFVAIAQVSLGKTGIFGPILSASPLRFMGKISYGLYIWHLPSSSYYDQMIIWAETNHIYIPSTTDYLFPRFDAYPLGYFYVNVAITFLLAICSYYLLEKPSLWIKDAYFR